jgi:hypothetical protein
MNSHFVANAKGRMLGGAMQAMPVYIVTTVTTVAQQRSGDTSRARSANKAEDPSPPN